jgi:hypothetical protein
MAIEPQNSPITRDTVTRWLDDWKEMDPQPDVRVYIAGKVNNLELEDAMVNTTYHDDYGSETPLVMMILDDLPSYGITDL